MAISIGFFHCSETQFSTIFLTFFLALTTQRHNLSKAKKRKKTLVLFYEWCSCWTTTVKNCKFYRSLHPLKLKTFDWIFSIKTSLDSCSFAHTNFVSANCFFARLELWNFENAKNAVVMFVDAQVRFFQHHRFDLFHQVLFWQFSTC